MTLQERSSDKYLSLDKKSILCHKCGAEIVFSKDHIAPSGKKVPLDPYFNREPHQQHCMYADLKWNKHTEALFTDFLSKTPRKKRVIGAVGRAK